MTERLWAFRQPQRKERAVRSGRGFVAVGDPRWELSSRCQRPVSQTAGSWAATRASAETQQAAAGSSIHQRNTHSGGEVHCTHTYRNQAYNVRSRIFTLRPGSVVASDVSFHNSIKTQTLFATLMQTRLQWCLLKLLLSYCNILLSESCSFLHILCIKSVHVNIWILFLFVFYTFIFFQREQIPFTHFLGPFLS